MDKQEVVALAQLLDSMLIAGKKLDSSYEKKDFEELEKTKKEILDIQKKIDIIVKR